jgi:hypothetical protein
MIHRPEKLFSKCCSNYYHLIEEEVLAYCKHLGYASIEEAHTSIREGLLSWEYWPDKQVLLNEGITQLVIYKPEITVDRNRKWDTSSTEYKVKFRRLYD